MHRLQVNALKLTAVAMAVGLTLAGCEKKKDAEAPERTEVAAAPTPAAPVPAPATDTQLSARAPLSPAEAAIARGHTLAAANCTRCHATTPGEQSKNASAPSFATLFTNYPPDYIAEAFAEGVFVGHGDMPAFEFAPEQINDLVAYLKTLSA